MKKFNQVSPLELGQKVRPGSKDRAKRCSQHDDNGCDGDGFQQASADAPSTSSSTLQRLRLEWAKGWGGGGNGDGKEYPSYQQRRLFLRRQPPLRRMIVLMWTSPITKFWTYQVLYILYLAMLSLAVIWPGCGNWLLDSAVCLWTCK